MTKTTVRRSHKDSLFRMIFSGKEELLSLYNALNGTDYQDAEKFCINTIEDVLYMGYKNDLSFLIGDYLNLYEAQSTWNPNLPLRGIFYFSKIYQGYVEECQLDIYSGKRLKLPTPQYVVFYNGTKAIPDKVTLKLSESFEKQGKDNNAYLIAKIREGIQQGLKLEVAVDAAVDKCIQSGVLDGLLRRHKAEVKEMILSEYNEELHIRSEKKLSFQEGKEEGEQIGKQIGKQIGEQLKLIDMVCRKMRKGKTPEKIAEELEEDPESVFQITAGVLQCGVDCSMEEIYEFLKKDALSKENLP
ncbi:MAG: hypothetical protein ACI4CZ_03970 [Hominisplanchenecus sp.]